MAKAEKKEMIYEELRRRCPSGLVPRREINIITGGLLIPTTMSNRDSHGTGIAGRKVIRHRVVYPIEDLINWIDVNTIWINFDD